MDTDGENFRGLHAVQLLEARRGWTLDKLQTAAFDSYQPGFAVLIPSLLRAYDALPASIVCGRSMFWSRRATHGGRNLPAMRS